MPHKDAGSEKLEALYAGAVAAARERRLDEAIRRLQQVLTLRSGVSEHLAAKCRRELGACYAEMGLLDEAIAELRAVVAADPADVQAGCQLASLYGRCGRHQEAIAEFRALLQRAPRSSEARSALCMCYIEQGDYQRAVETARHALKLDPASATARVDLAVALKHQGSLDEANAALDEVQGELPADPDRLCEMAEIRMSEGRLAQATAILHRALEVAPYHEAAIEMLAEAYVHLDDCPKAIETCQRSRRAGAARIPILDIMILASERSGELDAWLQYATELVQLCPMDAYAHYRLGVACQRRGDYPAAMERYGLAADLAGDDQQVAQSAEEAIEALDSIQQQQILALAGSNPVFRLQLQRDLEAALRDHGFRLTDEGMHLLASLDIEDLSRGPGPVRGGTVH